MAEKGDSPYNTDLSEIIETDPVTPEDGDSPYDGGGLSPLNTNDSQTFLEYLQGLLSIEAGSRSSGDSTLQANIDAEETARENADTVLQSNIDNKADDVHEHDDRYYTEDEVDSSLSGKSDTDHTHDSSDITDLAGGSSFFYEQTNHLFSVFDPICYDIASGKWILADNSDEETCAEAVITEITDANNFFAVRNGLCELTAHGLSTGHYYLSSEAITTTQPTTGYSQYLMRVINANEILITVDVPIEIVSTLEKDFDPNVGTIEMAFDATEATAYDNSDYYLYLDGSTVTGGQTLYPELYEMRPSWFSGGDLVLKDPRNRVLRAYGTDTSTVGSTDEDAFQGHSFQFELYGNVPAMNNQPASSSAAGSGLYANLGAPITDGVNGPPRTASETRVKSFTVKYYIKVKPEFKATVASLQLDDTPVDGETTEGITSNWAFYATKMMINNFAGLVLSNDTDTEHDINIASGWCVDSTGKYVLELNSEMTKQIDASWSAGDDAGGLDTGTVASDTWYYIYLIRKDSDGSIDALFSASATSPTMPTGYTYCRRLRGAILTDASANILGFYQKDNYFHFNEQKADIADTATGTARKTAVVSVPPDMLGQFSVYSLNAGTSYFLVSQVSDTDVAPNIGAFTLINAGGATLAQTQIQLIVNSSRQLSYRASLNSDAYINTVGFFDSAEV